MSTSTTPCIHPTKRVRYTVTSNMAGSTTTAFCMECLTRIDPEPVRVELDGATLLLFPNGKVGWE